MSSAADHQLYIQQQINPVLEGLVTQVLLERPEDPIPFMINWLSEQAGIAPPSKDGGELAKLKAENEQLKAQLKQLQSSSAAPAAEDSDDDDEEEGSSHSCTLNATWKINA